MQSTVALRYTKFAVKMLLGALFLVSALMKLIDIDKFELYVYSFDILSLGLSYIAARLVIGFEFLLGIALSVNIYNKYTIRITLLTLMVFTLFLVYAVLIGRTDNCHCFGEFVAFDPIESIIKNIVFIQEGLPYEKYSNEIFDIISIINLFPTDDALVESGFDIEINKDDNASNNETKEEEKIEVVKEEDLENFLINEGFIKTDSSIDTSIFLETDYISYLKEGITIVYYKGEDAKKVYNKIKTINGGEITFTNGELGTGCIIKDDINFSANCLYQNKESGVFIKYQEMNKDFAEKFIKIFGFSY